MIEPEGGIVANSTRALVPPRPNLGPEPWGDEGGYGLGVIIGVGAGLILVALLLGRGWVRARRPRPSRDRVTSTLDNPGPTNPWILASETARTALIRAFGPSWRSKTTEEIAADPDLRDRIGPDRVNDLIALFLRADRAKFAAEVALADEDEVGETDGVARGLAAIEPLVSESGPRKPEGR